MSQRRLEPLTLTVVRESRKLSQTGLAKAAGVSQSAVSQMEAGLFAPTEEVLGRLAEALRCPVSLLLIPLGFRQLPLTFFRKQARVGVRDVNAIRARVNLYRLRIEILLRSYDLQEARILLPDLKREGITASDAAQRLRVYWNVPPGPVKDLTGLLEKHGVLVVPIEFGHDSVDGLSLFEPNDELPPLIFLNTNLSPDRWRLSLAHELGHIILHHHLPVPITEKKMEEEAFEFAGEFLLPAREVAGHLRKITMPRLGALKKHWRVSMAALVMRATKLNYISERHARRFWIQLRKSGKHEPVSIEAEEAQMLREIIRHHLQDLGYSLPALARILHQPLDELRSDFGLASARLRLG